MQVREADEPLHLLIASRCSPSARSRMRAPVYWSEHLPIGKSERQTAHELDDRDRLNPPAMSIDRSRRVKEPAAVRPETSRSGRPTDWAPAAGPVAMRQPLDLLRQRASAERTVSNPATAGAGGRAVPRATRVPCQFPRRAPARLPRVLSAGTAGHWLDLVAVDWGFGLGEGDRYLHTLPLFHVNAWGPPLAVAAMGVPNVISRTSAAPRRWAASSTRRVVDRAGGNCGARAELHVRLARRSPEPRPVVLRPRRRLSGSSAGDACLASGCKRRDGRHRR